MPPLCFAVVFGEQLGDHPETYEQYTPGNGISSLSVYKEHKEHMQPKKVAFGRRISRRAG
jgi:hypothetical protein